MTDEQQKAAFAAFLIAEPAGQGRALNAACKLYPEDKDRGTACMIAAQWVHDPFVIAEMARLGEETLIGKVPSKTEVITQLWALAQDTKVMAKDRVAAAFMVAKVLKYVDSGDDGDLRRMPSTPVYKIVKQ